MPQIADGNQLASRRDFNPRMQALAQELTQQGLRDVILQNIPGVKKLMLKDLLLDYLDTAV